MKKICLLFLVLNITISSYSQVGINTTSPDTSAMLDIKSTDKGLLIPRMTSLQRLSIENPATSLLVYDLDLHQILQNAGTPIVPSWVPLIVRDTKNSFFYMPSISLDASSVVTNQTVDLYNEYKKQFIGANSSSFARSTSAPEQIPYFPSATELYYYITYYDNSVIKVNSLDDNGVLNYDILKETDFNSFMNVVFVIKP